MTNKLLGKKKTEPRFTFGFSGWKDYSRDDQLDALATRVAYLYAGNVINSAPRIPFKLEGV